MVSRRCNGPVSVVSRWCPNDVSVVFRVSVVSRCRIIAGPVVSPCPVVSRWCCSVFSGVPVVSRWLVSQSCPGRGVPVVSSGVPVVGVPVMQWFSLPVGPFVYQVWLRGWPSPMAALDTAHAVRPRVEIAAGYGHALCARGAESAYYGLIVFSELVYVRRRSRGTSPVVGPHLGGGPVCYNVLLHQRSMLCAFVKFQIGFCDRSCGRPFHPAATQFCQSSSGLTDGFSASRTSCHSLLFRTAWNYC